MNEMIGTVIFSLGFLIGALVMYWVARYEMSEVITSANELFSAVDRGRWRQDLLWVATVRAWRKRWVRGVKD